MQTLEGKIALITGAKGGLGSFVTEAFLAAGAEVVGTSRSIQPSDFDHPRFTAMAAELTSGDAASKLVDGVMAKFQRIDSLVHVLGGFAGGKTVAETDDAMLDKMLDLNFRAAFLIARAVVPRMRAQASGSILAVASRQAVDPMAGTGAYNASKAALVALIRTLALENKDCRISCNAVLPGTMDTPANRSWGGDKADWVQPAQVAALLVHLASDAGAQVTGAAIPIYGGQL